MSTPECDAAQNQTIPAPKKPSAVAVANPAQIVARQLIPFINGSQEFEALFLESDSYCFQGSQHALDEPGHSQLPCSMLNIGKDVWPSTTPHNSRSMQARTLFSNIALIPLPPSLGARHPPSSIYWMDIGTQALSVMLFIYVYIILGRRPRLQYMRLSPPAPFRDVLDRPTSRVTGLSQLGGLVQIRVVGSFYFLFWPLGHLTMLCFFSFGGSLEVWDLAKWLARDLFLDSCLSSKVRSYPNLTCIIPADVTR